LAVVSVVVVLVLVDEPPFSPDDLQPAGAASSAATRVARTMNGNISFLLGGVGCLIIMEFERKERDAPPAPRT
jgi:hypothetical protein